MTCCCMTKRTKSAPSIPSPFRKKNTWTARGIQPRSQDLFHFPLDYKRSRDLSVSSRSFQFWFPEFSLYLHSEIEARGIRAGKKIADWKIQQARIRDYGPINSKLQHTPLSKPRYLNFWRLDRQIAPPKEHCRRPLSLQSKIIDI